MDEVTNFPFNRVHMYGWCFASVVQLEVARYSGHTFEPYDTVKRQPHTWTAEEYQRELARIRDKGIVVGLTAREIDSAFRAGHTEAARQRI